MNAIEAAQLFLKHNRNKMSPVYEDIERKSQAGFTHLNFFNYEPHQKNLIMYTLIQNGFVCESHRDMIYVSWESTVKKLIKKEIEEDHDALNLDLS